MVQKVVEMQDRFFNWVNNIMSLGHLGLGVAVLISGQPRFTSASLQPLVYWSSGHMWVWGVWILISAILMRIQVRWPNIIGLWMGMVWHIIWGTSVTVAVIRFENASATGIPIFGILAALCAALLTYKAIDKTGG